MWFVLDDRVRSGNIAMPVLEGSLADVPAPFIRFLRHLWWRVGRGAGGGTGAMPWGPVGVTPSSPRWTP